MRATTRRRSHTAAFSFLALGAGLIAIYFTVPASSLSQALVFQAVGLLSLVAVVVGIRAHRPSRTLHLWLLALALGLFSLGNAIWNLYDFGLQLERPFPSVADLAYLGGYVALVAAILFLLRSRQQPALSDLLDGAIVLIGAGLVIWFSFAQSVAADGSLSTAARAVSTAYPAADVLLLVALSQLVITAGRRSFAFWAVSLGTAVLFGTDVLYGVAALDGTYVAGGPLDAGWMAMTLLWGAAVLHPSIRTLHEHAPLRQVRLTPQRLALLAAAALVTPLVLALHPDGGVSFDPMVIAVAAALSTLLIFARMWLLFREHGRAVAALGEAQARRDLDETLRVWNERFQKAARALECAIYEWHPDRDEILWSEGLAAAFGHPPERVGSSNAWFLEHVHPDDLEAVSATLGRALGGEDHGQTTYRFRDGDGSYRDVWDRWIVRRDAGGRLLGVIGGMVDVTKQNELEQQLRQVQKMEAVGRLAGGVAHDFNNLLLAIRGNAELLEASEALGKTERAEVREIVRASSRAAELTRQLLAFSRKPAAGPAQVGLNSAVADAESMLRRLLGGGIEVVTELGADVGSVTCDALGIEQIVVNLALNGRDAMPDGGRLLISTTAAAGRGVLTVEDTGIGMDDVTAGKAFEPFFTTKEVGKGTGLGLATVYGIVERAGGSVEVESEPGVGTSVRVFLPLVESVVAESVPERPAGAAGSETIMLVEDDAGVRKLVERMLTAHGYEVVAASSPEHALALIGDEELDPDLVVSDLVMPGMGGGALAARLGELRPGLRFLFISGYSEEAQRANGSQPLLAKPFTAAELTQAVRRALAAQPAASATA